MTLSNSWDYWHLCSELSVVQVTLLTIGLDPSEYEQYVLNWDIQEQPEGFNPTFTAITGAVLSGKILAKVFRGGEYIEYSLDGEDMRQWVTNNLPDWQHTLVDVESLKSFLFSRGLRRGFFFPANMKEDRPYLDKNNSFYAPKLAAAIKAWEDVSSNLDSSYRGKSPKQALMIWLRKNANEFGLLNEEGNPINQSIEEISKISNWKTSGGATKTPSHENPPTPETIENDIDTEIPF